MDKNTVNVKTIKNTLSIKPIKNTLTIKLVPVETVQLGFGVFNTQTHEGVEKVE